MKTRSIFAAAMLSVVCFHSAQAGPSLGLAVDLVGDAKTPNGFPLVSNGKSATIYLDPADHAGVLRAAGDLRDDVERVTTIKPTMDVTGRPAGTAVLVGTLGKSKLIDAWPGQANSTPL